MQPKQTLCKGLRVYILVKGEEGKVFLMVERDSQPQLVSVSNDVIVIYSNVHPELQFPSPFKILMWQGVNRGL